MSNTAVIQTPREKRYGFAMQGTFGTAEADTVSTTELDCEALEVNRDVKELEIAGAHGSRQQNAGDIIIHQNEAMPSFTIEAFLKKEELAQFLALYFQVIVEEGSAPFKKTLTLSDSQPDFQGGNGYFVTFFERVSEASKSIKVKDALMKSMTLTISADQPLKASMEFVGLGIPDVTSNPSGTWTRTDFTDTNLFYRSKVDICQVVLTAGTKAFHLHELELSFSRSVVGVGQDGSGGFKDYALAQPENKFKLTVPKDSDWSDVIADHNIGTEIDLRVGWGNASPGTIDGDLDFAIHGIMDGPDGATKTHDELILGTMTGRMLKSGSTESITIIMADNIDATWI